jgi:hypothetical protein
MIKKNYLILAHKNPDQLRRLIDRLNDSYSFFYIHIDQKSDINLFTNSIKGDNVLFLTNRINCLWGDFSQIIATIKLMEEAINSKRNGMAILLTGQDYPIKSCLEINNFIDRYSKYNFIDTIPVEQIWPDNYKDKTESYKFNLSAERGHCITFRKVSKASIKAFLKGKISLRQLCILCNKRRLKLNLQQYGGSAWWAFNTETLGKVYEYVKNNYATLYNYYQYTTCPDEIFFQTIAKHLSEQDPSIQLLPSFTYVNWTRVIDDPSPVTFTIDDFEELKSQPDNKLFARKFDTALDTNIFDDLDKMTGFIK